MAVWRTSWLGVVGVDSTIGLSDVCSEEDEEDGLEVIARVIGCGKRIGDL